eukprot:TRINITY_DN9579_c0_g2_i1.p1 TRINITY_DN9579_c0_g2~~TRINITY_DN9579_c0_g2_i1.p1  ORF type:complete len:110 (-),score=3.83 TRINITY_DN9579_c0_g2_i1:144-473(-)
MLIRITIRPTNTCFQSKSAGRTDTRSSSIMNMLLGMIFNARQIFCTAAVSTSIMGDQSTGACGSCYALKPVDKSNNVAYQSDHFDIVVAGFNCSVASQYFSLFRGFLVR